MKYYKEVILKNNTKCIIKTAEISMAKNILEHRIITASETDNLLRYPYEITDTVENQEQYISELANNEKRILLCAFIDDKLVATAGFSPVSPFEKLKHRASFGVDVEKEYWHMGIGSTLTKATIETCKTANYKQLELEVVSTNENAIRLYEKLGFKKCGTNDHAFLLKNGDYLAMHQMCLQL